jgi:hypothetical protein
VTAEQPTETKPVRTRLADLTGGIGRKLDEIKGETVTVYAIEFDIRQVHKIDPKGNTLDELEDKEVAIITCENDNRFYTFSAPLLAKLREVDPAALPALAVFDLKDIAGGRRVWTIS